MRYLAFMVVVLVAGLSARVDAQPLAAGVAVLDPTENLAEAKPGVVYQTVAATKSLDAQGQRAGELRYTFVLPQGFSIDHPCDISIILPTFGGDYRWGHTLLKPGEFRPKDITICVDGTSPADDGTREFRAANADAVVLRDFILEVSRTFPSSRIVLVGYRNGGRFGIAFASAFPRLINGVVNIAGGLYDKTNLLGAIQGQPLVLIHGTADMTTAYAISLDAERQLAEKGHPSALLRRVAGIDGMPPVSVINQAVDWTMAMNTEDPAKALATARAILSVDQRPCPPAFAMARTILRRFQVTKADQPKPPPGVGRIAPFETIDEDTRAAAWDLAVKIEQHAQTHVAALKAAGIASKEDLSRTKQPGTYPPHLGHLLALREDFRGVDTVEAYLKSIGYDELVPDHDRAASEIWGVLNEKTPAAQVFGTIVEQLPKAYLYDGLPPNLFSTATQLRDGVGEDALRPDVKAQFGVVELYEKAVQDGVEAYTALWAKFVP